MNKTRFLSRSISLSLSLSLLIAPLSQAAQVIGPQMGGLGLPPGAGIAASLRITADVGDSWAAQLGTFFSSDAPDLSMLSEVLPNLGRLDLADPVTQQAQALIRQQIQSAARRLLEAAPSADEMPQALSEGRENAAHLAAAQKLALLDTVLQAYLEPEERPKVAELSREYHRKLPPGEHAKIEAMVLGAQRLWQGGAVLAAGAVAAPDYSEPGKAAPEDGKLRAAPQEALDAKLRELFRTIRDPKLLDAQKSQAVAAFFAYLDGQVDSDGKSLLGPLKGILRPEGEGGTPSAGEAEKSPLAGLDDLVGSWLDKRIDLGLLDKDKEQGSAQAPAEPPTVAEQIERALHVDLRAQWGKLRDHLAAKLDQGLATPEGALGDLKDAPPADAAASGNGEGFKKQARLILALLRDLVKIEEPKVFGIVTPTDGLGPKIETAAELVKDVSFAVTQAVALWTLVSATKNLANRVFKLDDLIGTLKRGFKGGDPEFDALKRHFFDDYVPQVLRSVDRLGVFYTKVLQTISTFTYFFGEGTAEAFKHLNNKLAKNMPIQQVYNIIEEDLGMPADAAFVEIDPEPFASASMAQLHRAKIRLRSGKLRRVVLKVLKSNVVDELAWNLRVNRAMMNYFKSLTDDPFFLDFVADQLDELGRTFQAETDFPAETERLIRWRWLVSLDRGISVPRAYRRLSGRRIITMDEVVEAETSNFAADFAKFPKKAAAPPAATQAPSSVPTAAEGEASETERPASELATAASELARAVQGETADEAQAEAPAPSDAEVAPASPASEGGVGRMLDSIKDILVNLMQQHRYRVGPQYLQVLRSLLPYLAISVVSSMEAKDIDEEALDEQQRARLKRIKANLAAYDQAYVNQFLYFGEVHADMQPANVLHNKDGLHLIDLGNVVKTRGLIWRPIKLLLLIAKGDAPGIARLLEQMGHFDAATQQADVVASIQKVLDAHTISPQTWIELFTSSLSFSTSAKTEKRDDPEEKKESAQEEPAEEKSSAEAKQDPAPAKKADSPLAGLAGPIAAQIAMFPLRWLKYKLLGLLSGASRVLHGVGRKARGRAGPGDGRMLRDRVAARQPWSIKRSAAQVAALLKSKAFWVLAGVAALLGALLAWNWLSVAYASSMGSVLAPVGVAAYFLYLGVRLIKRLRKPAAPVGEEAAVPTPQPAQPEAPKAAATGLLGRVTLLSASAGALVASVPAFAYLLRQFNEGLGWVSGLTLSAETALLTGVVSLLVATGMAFALKQPPAAAKADSKAAVLFGAFIDEQLFRWGLFAGLLWWFSLLPLQAPIALAAAVLLSSFIFARYAKTPGVESFLDRFLLGGVLALVYHLTQSLWWVTFLHAFHVMIRSALKDKVLSWLDRPAPKPPEASANSAVSAQEGVSK